MYSFCHTLLSGPAAVSTCAMAVCASLAITAEYCLVTTHKSANHFPRQNNHRCPKHNKATNSYGVNAVGRQEYHLHILVCFR